MSFSAGPGNPGPAVLMASFPSRVAAQSDRPAGLVMNYPTGASKPGPGGLSSLSFGVSQTGLTVYSPGGGQGSGPMAQSVQQQQGAGPSAGAGQLGAIDMNPEKVLLTRVHISGIANAKSESQARSGSTSGTGAGAGPLVETKSSALTQNVGGKQNRSMDGAGGSAEGLAGGVRLVWPNLVATQEQAVRAMNLIAGGKPFPRDWTPQMIQHAFAMSAGREDGSMQANVQKWAQEWVMGVAQQQAQQQVQLQAQQHAQLQAQQQAQLQAQQEAQVQVQQQAQQQAQMQTTPNKRSSRPKCRPNNKLRFKLSSRLKLKLSSRPRTKSSNRPKCKLRC
ncbi:hypothetical protein MPTK1_7g10160 [Marchantia polymorpha subsp. ruderalis]|uniref:Uncharacterized protein n=2 Tax=Marchantia polymorpha TaxID=3197 RepID=A0AAF6BY07_MARPO|nr:hypothetical protein Mp_7g10160 [Marchantia polymorpha subsp. ruderalis]